MMCMKRGAASGQAEFEALEARAMGNTHPSTAEWTNEIKTSKYTMWSFLPLNLFQQFQNFSNIYFLAAAALQMIPGVSDSGGKPLILIPLCFVLFTTAVKDILQDVKMHASDAEENSRLTLRLRLAPNAELLGEATPAASGVAGTHSAASPPPAVGGGALSEDVDFDLVRWEELRVGDVVKVKRGEAFPADLVLLLSGEASGSAYVETKNLDGETNLKPKRTSRGLMELVSSGRDVRAVCASPGGLWLKYELPSPNLYKFDGELRLPAAAAEAEAEAGESGGRRMPVTPEQFVLRGSSLQTTKFVYGVVVYTGHKTRVFTNSEGSGKARYKVTKLMRTYSTHVLVLFALQLLLCTFCAVASDVFYAARSDWYLEQPRNWDDELSGSDVTTRGAKVFAALLLQFTYFVPISLLVSLELVKFAQAAFITNDKHMVWHHGDGSGGSVSSVVNNTSLSEELGAVSHVFSDKTGTLTENLMLFTALWVLGADRYAAITTNSHGHAHGHGHGEAPAADQDAGAAAAAAATAAVAGRDSHVHRKFSLDAFRHCVEEELDATARRRVRDLLITLGVCHTVLVKNRDGDSENSSDAAAAAAARAAAGDGSEEKRVYKHPWCCTAQGQGQAGAEPLDAGLVLDSEEAFDASSPDELALVAGARYLGFEFAGRPSVNTLTLTLTTEFARNLVCRQQDGVGVGLSSAAGDGAAVGAGPVALEFEVLEVLEFDNDRKRMSVLVARQEGTAGAVSAEFARTWPAGEAVLLCKGADSSMVAVAAKPAAAGPAGEAGTDGDAEEAEEWRETLQWVLEDFAKMGLRTLVFGRRVFGERGWVEEWRREYSLGRGAVGEEKKRRVEASVGAMEQELELVGCSGIEDKLQDGVSECIKHMHEAGIKLWILTGDKVETAINIGYSCELLDETVYNQIIDQPVAKLINEGLDEAIMMADKKLKLIGEELKWNEQAEEELRKAGFRVEKSREGSHFDVEVAANANGARRAAAVEMGEMAAIDEEAEEATVTSAAASGVSRVAITISGDALAVVFRHTELRNKFFRFALAKCTTVIACRVSPKQKADVVLYSGSYLPENTMLAIGDGANDVGMIVMAHVGVGVCGKEGQQAVRSADFAIGQFRFLERLLFLHGRETIRKNSQFLYFSVFKNVVFSIPVFFYALLSGFAPSNIYSAILKQLINLIYTMLPCMVYAVLDRELPTSVLARAPFLYKWPKRMFGLGVLWQWLLFAFWVGAWILYGSLWSLAPYAVTSRGYGTVDGEAIGMVIFFLVVLVVNVYIYRISSTLYTVTHVVNWTCTLFFVISWVIGHYAIVGIKGTLTEVGATARGFGTMLLVVGASFLPLALRHVHLALFVPSNARVARERVYVVHARELVEGKSADERRKSQRKSVIAKSFIHSKYREGAAAAAPAAAGDGNHRQFAKQLIEDAEHGFAFTEDTGAERLGLYAIAKAKRLAAGAGPGTSDDAAGVPDDVPRSIRYVAPVPEKPRSFAASLGSRVAGRLSRKSAGGSSGSNRRV